MAINKRTFTYLARRSESRRELTACKYKKAGELEPMSVDRTWLCDSGSQGAASSADIAVSSRRPGRNQDVARSHQVSTWHLPQFGQSCSCGARFIKCADGSILAGGSPSARDSNNSGSINALHAASEMGLSVTRDGK